MRQSAFARFTPSRRWAQASDWKHIRIRPVPRLCRADPVRGIRKLILNASRKTLIAVPDVPHVVRDSPHLRILCHLVLLTRRRGSRRKTKNHSFARLLYRLAKHSNLVALIRMVRYAVDLYKVDVPGRIEPRKRVVVILRRRLAYIEWGYL